MIIELSINQSALIRFVCQIRVQTDLQKCRRQLTGRAIFFNFFQKRWILRVR